MAGGKTTLGKKIILNRSYKATPDYTVPSQFKTGTGTTAFATSDTDVENVIPIEDGTTNDDGSNQLTGSNGGSNSTDNTSVYKPGAGLSDNTAQNLIATTGNATKTWAISDLSSNGTVCQDDEYTVLWIYIKDDVTLDKFLSAGTALEIKIGSDSSNYYSKTYTAAVLQTGWNYIDLGILNTNTETGTVTGTIDYFEIEITTNNTSDTFAAGDVVYDLLRQYVDSDTLKDFTSVTINEPALTVTTVCELAATDAVGYDISELGTFNTDTTPKMDGRDVFTAQSKGSDEEFKFTIVEGFN